ncbi:hypothetical protein FB45DRAFT_830944 [Roridomyces roridus]|uniref:F-box domain-containing protein n=1 Tax=Roridomyces roridus TaxID=1738132 RepID=A0AAD7FP62_9AGAR|nr:hypothetical protein FB45DRAFT_830944 [Roridomyces roridus]
MPEILDIIFRLVCNPRKSGDAGTKTLAALARTCTTFRDPALNILWCHQSRVQPALALFPKDLWVSNQTKFEFSRDVRPSDWDRPIIYFARIRSFEIDSMVELPIDVLQALALRCPTTRMFPNLRNIEWVRLYNEPNILPVLQIFSAPRLDSIGLTPGHSEEELIALRTLSHRWPALTNLALLYRHIRMPTLSPLIRAATTELVRALTKLESFQAIIDVETFIELSKLPNLQFVGGDIVEYPETTPFFAESAFPALRMLSVVIRPELIIQLISTVHLRTLASLELTFDAGLGTRLPNAATIANLYTAIATHCSPASLTTLSIRDSHLYAEDPAVEIPLDDEFDTYVVGPDTLRILEPFTNLTCLILEPYHGFDIDNAMILKMAPSWLNLEKLHLAYNSPESLMEHYPRVTMMGVQLLSLFCRDLKSLTLLFDATETQLIDPLPDSFPRHFPQTELTLLDVNFSAIEDHRVVTDILKSLFPNVGHLSFRQQASDNEKVLWSLVSLGLRGALPELPYFHSNILQYLQENPPI